MSRVAFLIDGFNLYHALNYSPVHHRPADPYRYRKYKWLNLRQLAEIYASIAGDEIVSIYYFTAFAHWMPAKVSRHQQYINALLNEKVNVIYGEFKARTRHCSTCRQDFLTHEEKQTDVNIAVTLFRLAVEDEYDKVIIISGDTDILPAVRLVQSKFPEKKVGVVIPIGKASEEFKRAADFHYKMRESHLAKSQFNDRYVMKDGKAVMRPKSWS